jgi:hypothetical protein
MRVVDLTQSMTNGMPAMEGITPPSFRDLAEVAVPGCSLWSTTDRKRTSGHGEQPVSQQKVGELRHGVLGSADAIAQSPTARQRLPRRLTARA